MTHPAEISSQPVVRDRWGGWTHPAFFEPALGEIEAPGEFMAWLAEHNLAFATTWKENEVDEWQINLVRKSDNCSDWLPSRPSGDAWFTGSIHDTEDGQVCIWLRHRIGGDAA